MSSEFRVGYVLKRYPRLSETFIIREIIGIESAGVDVSIFALSFPEDGRFHADVARVRGRATYLPRADRGSTVLAAIEGLTSLPRPADTILPEIFAFLDRLPRTVRHAVLLQGLTLAGEVARAGIDLLHAHFMTGAAHVAYVAHLATGVPFTVTAHAKDIFSDSVDPELFRQMAFAAQKVITVSAQNKAFMVERLDVPGNKIEVVYNGVALDIPSPPAREPGLIVSVGRLVEKKGLPVLLHAAAALREAGRQLDVVIIGEGEERTALVDLRDTLGLAGIVTFLGAQPNHVALDWIQRATGFAAPFVVAADGNQDALPTVLIEAMAVGTPIVTSRVGGVPEMVDHGVEGLITEPGDVQAFAAGLDRILTDPAAAGAMRAAGPRKVDRVFHQRHTIGRLLHAMGHAVAADVSAP